MSTDATAAFVGIRIQGGLLPADLLAKLTTGTDLPGLTSRDFHLPAGESVRDAANRVWAYLRGAWTTYRQALEARPDSDAATSLTRERFTLVLLEQLGYGRVPTTGKGGITVGQHGYPVSHVWGSLPIHLLGRVPLDTRTRGVAGAAGASPQSMVQELLNRSDDHLWAILANSTTLRLLRDSTSLVGSAYVEFDLEAIFDGDLFADFLLLYTLCHVSRVEARDTEVGPASCWLEQWRQDAVESGSRALNLLRDGVVDALQTLGAEFLAHPDNSALREDLAEGRLSVDDVHHALLRVAYRLLFTFVAEDRGALLDPNATPQARQRYATYFSTDRLRRTSRRRRGGRYGDKWQALTLVWRALGSVEGLPELGLPGVGGLFDRGELDFLTDCALSNQALQSAVRSLSVVREPKSQVLRVVDYRNLGAEELGSIYEALLEFVPHWDPATKTYELSITSGNQRKDTGSYYTPTSLVESLLDTALDPVLDDAEKSDDAIEALLNVTVCDPACGSGHFLVGAARRIAKRVAAFRTGDPEPTPEAVRSAMRDVAGRCIYGVDVNPLAAELAKVSLWMEALEPGRPLTFLDAQIKVGNALVGATPKLLAEGLPDEAFKPIEGDDKKVAATLAKQNKAERSAQGSLFDIDMVPANTALGEQVLDVVAAPALSLSDVHVQQQRLRAYAESDDYRRQRLAADAWCAAFVWPKTQGAPKAITHRTVTQLTDGDDALDKATRSEVERLAAEYRFFHWHLEFPHIFPTAATGDDTVNPATGCAGGFSVVLGNPPWERVKLQEQEFFAARDPQIAKAPNAAARKRLIAKLPETNQPLHTAFIAEKRRAEGNSHIMRTSGRYPLTGRGDINTYAVFAETDRNLIGGHGRLGVILPTGIATDATTQYYFKDLVANEAILSLYSFREIRRMFPGTDDRNPFCLLTLCGRVTHIPEGAFAFRLELPSDLLRPDMSYKLAPEEIQLLNPNTGTCPAFRSRRDAEITLGIYKRVPILIREGDPDGNPWGIKFMTMFHMSNDSDLFHTRDELESEGWELNDNVFEWGKKRMLPLYEGKMGNIFDHRSASFTGAGDTDIAPNENHAADASVLPRYWVTPEAALERQLRRDWGTNAGMLGFRRSKSVMPMSVDEKDVLLMSLTGLVSQNSQEDVVVQGSGLSRGDKRRNARLARLRELVRADHAIVGIDLADEKQAVVITDHDSRVLARRRVKAKAWELGPVLAWARQQARRHGFADVTIGCEPTGHRWRVLDQLAAQQDMAFVCVQPLLVGRAREREDYTRDKTDKDAVLIARLVAQLSCYAPERADATWAHLRQLGARRCELITQATRCVQQLRDLLECAWPAVLSTAAQPFDATNWCAALAVVLERCNGQPQRLARLGQDRFVAAVRREVPRWGGVRAWRPIIDAVFAALSDPAGVLAQRPGALERAKWVLADWRLIKIRLAQVEARMVEILDQLELTRLVTTIPGISPVGAAAILAETGDPTRFDSPRALVKHAGLCPRENTSGTMTGRSRISGRGRPRLRLAAWRAVWGALSHNPVMAARYRHLTTRTANPLNGGQARAAIAAALLRWIHVLTTQRVSWDPSLASAGNQPAAAA